MLDKLVKKYAKMQKKYGDPNLDSINFGGCLENPDVCFVFMNPTARNVTSSKKWKGIKSPWVDTAIHESGIAIQEIGNKRIL